MTRGASRGVGLCIGASVDFVLGDRPRAPRWVQRLNLEWAFRLASEPARLWRRYLVEGPRIFLLFWRWKHGRLGQIDSG
jgi:N-acetylglucosaminyldiphosphoundecaprenol N-acetyl-beta-D-mannosaminyltransferase